MTTSNNELEIIDISQKPTRFDRIQMAMFNEKAALRKPLTQKEEEIKQRYEAGFAFWLNNPHLDKTQVARFIRNKFDIQRSSSFDDVKAIEIMLANVKTASKEWLRHMVIEMCRKAYNMALAKSDPKGMVLAADKIGRYAKLDQDEIESLPWEKLIPPNFEPSPDVSILGIETEGNTQKRIDKLRKKYLAKYSPQSFADAKIIEEDDD